MFVGVSFEGSENRRLSIGGKAMTKRRYLLLFSGTTALALGIGVCAAMAPSTPPRVPSRDFGRMVLAYELQRIHWKSCCKAPDSPGPVEMIDAIADGCIPETVDYKWTVRFIPRSPGITVFEGVKPDKLEEAGISEMENGTGEFWQESSDGTWRLIAALRTEKSCYVCHRDQSENAAMHHDDTPLGYASITLTHKVSGK